MPRPTRAVIDLDALRHNYARAVALAAPAKAMAVVKADGYGHGLADVARALAHAAPLFAVALVEEADIVRAAVPDTPVLLLQGAHDPADWTRLGPLNYIGLVHSEAQVEALEQAPLVTPTRLWIKVNTGMNRLGFRPDEVAPVLARLEAIAAVRVEVLMTHFARADEAGDTMTAVQVGIMTRLRRLYPHLAISAANSAGLFADLDTRFDWARPGIMLYGGTPLVGSRGRDLGLEPAMTLESQLIAVRDVEVGETVGYGATWYVERPTRMGVVAVGYGDGYPRHAPAGTPVSINGLPVPLIGRVSMDMITVDLGDCLGARPGDRVELWGRAISIDDVARLAGTISYELMTGITARVPRVYRSSTT